MPKEKARILLPNGHIIERTVTSVLKGIPTSSAATWRRTIRFKNRIREVKLYFVSANAKYTLTV